ncbi:MAG: class II glutamine amidotransferase [Nanoarchaeota archaeon]|nr:class II glutamine amidotransferase [Nanoarchaeota archaeon]MBU1632737.1 class II glutamine amidotransferase [Nanoarchaeota archaeon]MBU1876653.1 class II glutamine amidotransferase [Nanoarchaeota archaeon]
MLIALGKIDVKFLIEEMILISKDMNQIHEFNKDNHGNFKHDNGWGIAYLDQQKKWKIIKSTKPIFEDPKIEKIKKIKTNLIIIHARKSKSEMSLNNTHPFTYNYLNEKILFFHNGTLEQLIHFNNRYKLKGNTDSEQLFYSILSDLKNRDYLTGIKKNLNKYTKKNGSNIIFSLRDKLFIAVKDNEYPLYFNMYLGKNSNQIIVSSEILPHSKDLSWETITENQILTLDHNKHLILKDKIK